MWGDVTVVLFHQYLNEHTHETAGEMVMRYSFHTGFCASTDCVRCIKDDLDLACADDRFDDNFAMDIVLELDPTHAAFDAPRTYMARHSSLQYLISNHIERPNEYRQRCCSAWALTSGLALTCRSGCSSARAIRWTSR